MPHLVALAEKYKDASVVVVSIDPGKRPKGFDELLARFGSEEGGADRAHREDRQQPAEPATGLPPEGDDQDPKGHQRY